MNKEEFEKFGSDEELNDLGDSCIVIPREETTKRKVNLPKWSYFAIAGGVLIIFVILLFTTILPNLRHPVQSVKEALHETLKDDNYGIHVKLTMNQTTIEKDLLVSCLNKSDMLVCLTDRNGGETYYCYENGVVYEVSSIQTDSKKTYSVEKREDMEPYMRFLSAAASGDEEGYYQALGTILDTGTNVFDYGNLEEVSDELVECFDDRMTRNLCLGYQQEKKKGVTTIGFRLETYETVNALLSTLKPHFQVLQVYKDMETLAESLKNCKEHPELTFEIKKDKLIDLEISCPTESIALFSMAKDLKLNCTLLEGSKVSLPAEYRDALEYFKETGEKAYSPE